MNIRQSLSWADDYRLIRIRFIQSQNILWYYSNQFVKTDLFRPLPNDDRPHSLAESTPNPNLGTLHSKFIYIIPNPHSCYEILDKHINYMIPVYFIKRNCKLETKLINYCVGIDFVLNYNSEIHSAVALYEASIFTDWCFCKLHYMTANIIKKII